MSAPLIARPSVPDAPTAPPRPHLAVLVVLAGLLAAVALPFAPVVAERAAVTWPVPGEPARSSTAFFVPYRPATLTATVPCAGNPPATLLATGPDGVGLTVRAVAEGTRVELQGRIVASGTGCGATVTADGAGVVVDLAGVRTVLPGEPTPEVLALRTDLAEPTGLLVVATTASPWQSSPTSVKLALVVVQLLAVVLALALLSSRRGDRKATLTASAVMKVAFLSRGCRGLLDAAVVIMLLGWAVIGPLSDDDGFAAAIARSVAATGDAGNYYRWWNASETPFALSQQLLAPWIVTSPAPLWLRIPSTVLGIATWFVVSRGVLGVLAPGRLAVRAMGAVFLLAAWLPFNLAVRPEPWVAFGVVAVLGLLLRARGPAGIGVAAAVAGLTVPLSPTGLLVLAPVVACAPRIGRILRDGVDVATGTGRGELAVRVGLVVVAGSVAMTAVFADQTWHGVLLATQLHTGFGPALPWYAELARYDYLLGDNHSGSFAKRLPVLLALALLVTVAATLLRRGRTALGDGTALLAVAVAVAFVLLVPLPSKWSHHFGSLAGLVAPFAALAVAGLWRAGGRGGGVLGAGLVSLAAAVSFAGPNAWWQPVNYPLPWAAEPVRPGGVPLDSPLPWLVVGVLVVGLLGVRTWSGVHRRPDAAVSPGLVTPVPAGGLLARSGTAPAAMAVVAAGTAVVVLLGTFGTAPLRRPDGYTLAQANLDRLTGGAACALADRVEVMPDVPGGVLQPVAAGLGIPLTDPASLDERLAPGVPLTDPASLVALPEPGVPTATHGVAVAPPPAADVSGAGTGWIAGGGFQPDLPPGDPPGRSTSEFLWGSRHPDATAVGELTGPWFGLPALDGRQVALSVAGRIGGGTSLELEFGRGGVPLGRATPVGANTVDPAKPPSEEKPGRQPGLDAVSSAWRTIAVDAAAVPAGADQVRIRAVDAATDPDGWLATTGPRLRDVLVLRDFLAARGPVLVDWPVAFVLPCVLDRPLVADGLAAAPGVRIVAPAAYAGLAGITTARGQGGNFLGVAQARTEEVASRLVGAPDLEWGHVELLDHGLARDAYRVTRTSAVTWGWQG